jgi:hypothetical protein
MGSSMLKKNRLTLLMGIIFILVLPIAVFLTQQRTFIAPRAGQEVTSPESISETKEEVVSEFEQKRQLPQPTPTPPPQPTSFLQKIINWFTNLFQSFSR